MKCVPILAEVDALIDSAPPAPRRMMLKEDFEDPVGSPRGLQEAGLAALSGPNRCEINLMLCAWNSLSSPLEGASDSQTGISPFQWWAA
jgi:hypothetical protein